MKPAMFLLAVPVRLSAEPVGSCLWRNRLARHIDATTQGKPISLLRIAYGLAAILVSIGLLLAAACGWHTLRPLSGVRRLPPDEPPVVLAARIAYCASASVFCCRASSPRCRSSVRWSSPGRQRAARAGRGRSRGPRRRAACRGAGGWQEVREKAAAVLRTTSDRAACIIVLLC